MSRTLKQMPYHCLRHPKGHKQALVQGARAVPPDPWDDIPHDKQAWQAWQAARSMVIDGASDKRIIASLTGEWGLTMTRAVEIVDRIRGRVVGRGA